MVDWGYTGFFSFRNTFYYVINGQVDFSVDTLIQDSDSTWYYVKNGAIASGFSGLVLYNNI